MSACKYTNKCGGCVYQNKSYKEQIEIKEKELKKLMKGICEIKGMEGMENPMYYRNKVHAVFGYDKSRKVICGTYKEGTHQIIDIKGCQIEDQKCGEIIQTIKELVIKYKIKVYDEDRQNGYIRHVLLRRGFTSGEIMVVLVCANMVFHGGKEFTKELLQLHPEITTIILNENHDKTTFVLGKKEKVLYGKGYITDVLCGHTFRISSGSFYQINPVQTEKLYRKAIELADLKGDERVIDAYCGIGTIAITASDYAKEVIGVELNEGAVIDAKINANENIIKNVKFIADDAGKFMKKLAHKHESVDVVFMDPPRSGSTNQFIDCVAVLAPKKVVYISCGPDTLARDLKYFKKKGYEIVEGYGFDLFPFTSHVETVCLLSRKP